MLGIGAVRTPDRIVFRLEGELDVFSRRELLDYVRSELSDRDRHRLVVLDLAALDFCDAGGADTLAQAGQFAAMHGCEVVVRDAPDMVRRMSTVLDLPLCFDGDTALSTAAHGRGLWVLPKV